MQRPVTAFLVQGLRRESRSIPGHVLRGVVLGVALLCLVFASFVTAVMGLGAPGLTTFSNLLSMNALWIWIAAAFFFGGCITAEREEGTLALLRLTGMSTLALLLGKIGDRLLATACLLLGQLPFSLLVVTLGGVSTEQVLAGFVTLAAQLLLAASVGVLFSTLCASHLYSGSLTLGLLFGFSVLHGVASMAGIRVFEWVYPLSHLQVVQASADPTGTALVFLRTVAVALPILGLAWLCLSRITYEKPDAASRAVTPGKSTAAPRVRGLGARALMWKERRHAVGGARGMLVRALVYAVLIVGIQVWWGNRVAGWELWASTLLWVGLVGFLLETALMTECIIRPEINERSLPSLAMLPVSVHRLLWWKSLGCYTAALMPLGILLAFLVLMLSVSEPHDFDDHRALSLLAATCFVLALAWILYLLLVLLLSMFLRWGAWLVALFASSLAHQFIMILAFMTLGPLFLASTVAGSEIVGLVLSVLLGGLVGAAVLWGVYTWCVARLRFLISG